MGNLRRHRSIDGKALDGAILNPPKDGKKSIEVHRLLKNVFHYFANKRMVRDLNVAFDIFKAGRSLGENARK